MKNKTTVFSTKGLTEVMITNVDISIDNEIAKLQLNKHSSSVSPLFGNSD